MKRSLSKMNTNQLRDLAVILGADRKKLYGTSKQSLIFIIHEGIALFPEDSQHFFRIHKVFITAQ